MTSKGLGILGTWLLFAVLPAFTQVPSGLASPLTTAGITPLQLAPMALDGPLLGSTAQQSILYSGYAVTGSSFTQAKGSWHVPGVNCGKTPNAASAFWVGIDGVFADSATAEETGTVSQCNGSTPQYYAWYQFSGRQFDSDHRQRPE